MESEYMEMMANGVIHAAQEQFMHVQSCMTDPSVIYRPKLSIDGDMWCALYGDDLQCGVAGFGVSPHAAMCDFNRAWYTSLNGKEVGRG